jgi:choline transport protein
MEKSIDLHTLDDELRHRRLSASEGKGSDFDRDRYDLARAGKQQVLKVGSHDFMPSAHNAEIGQRRFGLVSMTGLSCGLMCTWESILV